MLSTSEIWMNALPIEVRWVVSASWMHAHSGHSKTTSNVEVIDGESPG
jgi:hypothetical protein